MQEDKKKTMTSEVCKLLKKRGIKKKDRVFEKKVKARISVQIRMCYQNIDKTLKDLKSTTQNKFFAAYWAYIYAIITPMDKDNYHPNQY